MKRPDSNKMLTTRKLALILVGVVFALVLLGLMIWKLDVTLAGILRMLDTFPWWGLLLVGGLTIGALALSSYQWKMTLRFASAHEPQSEPPFTALWFYTTLGTFMGQLIPIQLSVLIVRSVLLRWREGTSVTRGGATSLIEQLVSLSIPLVFFVPGIIALQGLITFQTWLVISLALLGVSWGAIVFGLPALVRQLNRQIDHGWLHTLRQRNRRFAAVLDKVTQLQQFNLLRRDVLQTLYAIAFLRYTFLAARIMCLMYLFGLDLSPLHALYMVPTLQMMQLFNFTPGNLGLREWTWVGLLTLSGIDPTTAATYALAQRVIIFVLVATSTAIVYVLFLRRRPRPALQGSR